MNDYRRAQEFMPFDALKGFKEAIKEKEKEKIIKKNLSIDEASDLDFKLHQMEVGKMYQITYYRNDNYYLKTGLLSKLDKDNKYLKIVKDKINFDELIEVLKVTEINNYE